VRSDAAGISLVRHANQATIIGSTGAAPTPTYSRPCAQDVQVAHEGRRRLRSAAESRFVIKRNEVDGRCGWSWSSLGQLEPRLYESKSSTWLLQLAARKLDELAHVPLLTDVAGDRRSNEPRSAHRLPQTMAAALCDAARCARRPPAGAARGVRCDHEGRRLFTDAKAGLEVRPISGADADALIRELYATPRHREARGPTI